MMTTAQLPIISDMKTNSKTPLRRNYSDSYIPKIIEDYTPSNAADSEKAEGKSASTNSSPAASKRFESGDDMSLPRPQQQSDTGLMSYSGFLKASPVSMKQLQSISKTVTQTAVELTSNYGWKMYEYWTGSKGDSNGESKFEEYFQRSCPECQYNNYAVAKALTAALQGYRTCGLCSNTFCYSHCNFQRRITASNTINKSGAQVIEVDSDGAWIHVCKRCYEKGKTQTLGQTRDHTHLFVEKRAKKNNVLEKRQDRILSKLEKLSKELPEDNGGTFSIWNIQNALPILQVAVPYTSSTKNCNVCTAEFSFWVTRQSCQLCSSECCSNCCRYTVPLSKSIINPNAPNRSGELSICKYCHELLAAKKKRIKFSQLCSSDKVKQLVQMYQYASDLKREIDKRLSEYLEKSQTLESSILDSFQLVPSSTDERPEAVSLSDSVRTESQQMLESLVPMFVAYEKSVNEILSIPCSTEKEKKILSNLKVAFLRSQAYTVLSQRNLTKMLHTEK